MDIMDKIDKMNRNVQKDRKLTYCTKMDKIYNIDNQTKLKNGQKWTNFTINL